MALESGVAAFLQFYRACHRRHVRDRRARRVLNANQGSILQHLDSDEPTNLHVLARHMGVTASTMSLNVDRLEQAGYVRRERDARDARRVELRLTESGQRLKDEQNVLDRGMVGKLMESLGQTDRRTAIEGLRLLAEAARDLVDERKFEMGRRHTHSGRAKGNS